MFARKKLSEPEEVSSIRAKLRQFLSTTDSRERQIGSARCGIYAFYDYDGEPIYAGQTYEKLRGRIGRHLTNQRTDAVAMNVLDPFEVAEVEIWPLWDLPAAEQRETLARAEYTVHKKLISESRFGAILNEKPPPVAPEIELPPSYRGRIIPDDIYVRRKHPDIRIARRASTIAKLAQVISERAVSNDLRRVLVTQALRLEYLARTRLTEAEESSGLE